MESGNLWHRLSKQYCQKYGKNYDLYIFGFDFKKLNQQERLKYELVYRSTMIARGIVNVKMPRGW